MRFGINDDDDDSVDYNHNCEDTNQTTRGLWLVYSSDFILLPYLNPYYLPSKAVFITTASVLCSYFLVIWKTDQNLGWPKKFLVIKIYDLNLIFLYAIAVSLLLFVSIVALTAPLLYRFPWAQWRKKLVQVYSRFKHTNTIVKQEVEAVLENLKFRDTIDMGASGTFISNLQKYWMDGMAFNEYYITMGDTWSARIQHAHDVFDLMGGIITFGISHTQEISQNLLQSLYLTKIHFTNPFHLLLSTSETLTSKFTTLLPPFVKQIAFLLQTFTFLFTSKAKNCTMDESNMQDNMEGNEVILSDTHSNKFRPVVIMSPSLLVEESINWAHAILLRWVTHDFYDVTFLTRMIEAEWGLRSTFEVKRILERRNMFCIILNEKKDYDRVRLEAPWIVDGHFIAVRPIIGFGLPTGRNLDIHFTHLWVQIPNVKKAFLLKAALQSIVQRVGLLKKIDNREILYFSEMSETVRLLIKVDMRKFLPEGSKVKVGKITFKFTFIYEKLPGDFCKICRILDHKQQKCSVEAGPSGIKLIEGPSSTKSCESGNGNDQIGINKVIPVDPIEGVSPGIFDDLNTELLPEIQDIDDVACFRLPTLRCRQSNLTLEEAVESFGGLELKDYKKPSEESYSKRDRKGKKKVVEKRKHSHLSTSLTPVARKQGRG